MTVEELNRDYQEVKTDKVECKGICDLYRSGQQYAHQSCMLPPRLECWVGDQLYIYKKKSDVV